MKYLLDTNTCICYINGRAPQIREHMRLIVDTDIAISTVTMGEMFFGSAKSGHPKRSRTKQDAFFIRFAHLVYDKVAAEEFGRIRALWLAEFSTKHLDFASSSSGLYGCQLHFRKICCRDALCANGWKMRAVWALPGLNSGQKG